jgi:thiamine-phosphate pyrophosphorylase
MVDLASAFLEGGASLVQLRAKGAPGGWMLETAAAIVERSHRGDALVIINDRADIARLSGADGVHVGQDDLSPAAVRRLVGADALVGLSTHTDAQVEAAASQPVSYVAIGPVFPTGTKATGYDSRGVEAVRRAANATAERGVPLVAIGGVTLETAPDVLRAGASAVAVIGDLMSGDPAARVREYLKRLTV